MSRKWQHLRTAPVYVDPPVALSDWIAGLLAVLPPTAKGHIRIAEGYPDYLPYWSMGPARTMKHVHATIRYAHGKIAFRSRNATDEVMAATIVKYARTETDYDVFVYVPGKRRSRRRPGDPRPRQWPDVSRQFEDEFDDLPF